MNVKKTKKNFTQPEIDRIQVITPSKTIKKQLNIKFEELFDKIKKPILSQEIWAKTQNCFTLGHVIFYIKTVIKKCQVKKNNFMR